MYSKFGQFIDGKWQTSEKKETYEVINPANEEIIGKGEEILLCIKQYISGVSDQEFREWESICQQIWLSDSKKSMPNVDRVRRTTRKVLKEWIGDIFDREENYIGKTGS